MDDPALRELTSILDAAGRGEPGAAERLLPLVYDELRRLARARLRRVPPGQTLQPTALVHEAWLRVAGREERREPDREQARQWNDRGHFFAVAARAMRDIMVEDARRKDRLKRGGDRRRVPVDGTEAGEGLAIEPPADDMLALDEALDRLEREHPDHARVVMLRSFTGLTTPQTAEALGVSPSTVERSWRFARAWLREALEADDDASGGARQ